MRRSGSWIDSSPPPLSPAQSFSVAAAAGQPPPRPTLTALTSRSPVRGQNVAAAAGGVVTRVKREGTNGGVAVRTPSVADSMPLIGSSLESGSAAAAAATAPSTPSRNGSYSGVQVKRQPSSGGSSASWSLSPRRASLEDSEACAWNIAGEESQNAAIAAASAAAATARTNNIAAASAARPVSSPARTQLRSAAQKCPVRGCTAAYVKAASLHKHMKLLHRGARATRELASSIPTETRAAPAASPAKNARKRKLVVDPAAAVIAAAAARADSNVDSTASTPTSTPRKSPRARRATTPLPTAAAPAAAASSSSAAAAESLISDEEDEDEFDSDASDSDSSSGSEGAPRQVALPVRLPPFNAAQQMPQWPSSTAAAAAPASARSAAAKPSASSAAAAIPSGSRILPPYALASAFPAHVRDGSHPVLALLSKLLAQHASQAPLHRDSRLSVDDLLAQYLLSRFDLRSNPAAAERKSFQALLTHVLWIRGGLERWARNWKKYSVPKNAPTPTRTPKRRGSKTESQATAADADSDDADSDDSEASWWRRFNLASSYSLIPLLGRMRSFLDVTFKHGEGKNLPPEEQEAVSDVIRGAKKWAHSLPAAPPSVASLPSPMEMVPQAAAAGALAVQQQKQQQRKQAAAAAQSSRLASTATAASSASAAPTRSSSTSRSAAAAAAASASDSPLVPPPPVWTASSLSQLNSLLLSNNGLVNRNLTLRQIAETLGEGHTAESVRVRVDQIRKAKSMEESRAALRAEQERKQAVQERIVEAARTKSKRSRKNAADAEDDEDALQFGAHPLSSVIPSMGNRGRKRKASAANEEQQAAMSAAAQAAAPLASRARATQRAGARTYSPVRNHPAPAAAATAAALPAAAVASSSSAAAAAPAAEEPPAKRPRQSKKQKQALADAEAAAAAAAAASAAGSPPPQQYGMMPYPMHPGGMMPQQHGMMPYPYPMHPYAAPPPPPPAAAAGGRGAAAAAAAAPPPPPPVPYPYPSPYGMPWPTHGHAGMPPHPGSYPPPPPPPSAGGQQMQWSWMLVPMPVQQAAPVPNAPSPAGRR